jgi:hypothetical protein
MESSTVAYSIIRAMSLCFSCWMLRFCFVFWGRRGEGLASVVFALFEVQCHDIFEVQGRLWVLWSNVSEGEDSEYPKDHF